MGLAGLGAVDVAGVSVDTQCYDLAKAWLVNAGWHHDATIMQLAQRIQETMQDFESDLAVDTEDINR